ncbi:hypothetical protein GCM10011416_11040 [Polaribacter pacificus]|uniref:Transcriptional regulator, BadM/Rrf2 family n=2 Tax=Polaribacter pacificus TaxID=1775173 RepID=A0A917HX84_9FLAO|nr:hypothetical protein GCM10011416_11040 [Polaribacter pacificus]
MMFSKSCEYGLRAVLFIAKNSVNNTKVGLVEIAKEIDSPSAFTAKILQQLTKAGLIESSKGPQGGFFISKTELNELRLASVVEALDGSKVFEGCGLGLSQCDDQYPCPMHNEFLKVRTELKQMLTTTKVLELATQLNDGETWLKRI